MKKQELSKICNNLRDINDRIKEYNESDMADLYVESHLDNEQTRLLSLLEKGYDEVYNVRFLKNERNR